MFRKVPMQEQIRTDRQEGYAKQGIQQEDINEVGKISAFTLEDNMVTGEMIGMMLLEIEDFKNRINILEGGR